MSTSVGSATATLKGERTETTTPNEDITNLSVDRVIIDDDTMEPTTTSVNQDINSSSNGSDISIGRLPGSEASSVDAEPDKLVEHFKKRFEREKRKLDLQHEAQMRALMSSQQQIVQQQQQQQQSMIDNQSTCQTFSSSSSATALKQYTNQSITMGHLQTNNDNVNIQNNLHRLKLQEVPQSQLQKQLQHQQQQYQQQSSQINNINNNNTQQKQLYDNQKLEQLKNKEKHEQSAVASQEVKEHLAGFILSKRQQFHGNSNSQDLTPFQLHHPPQTQTRGSNSMQDQLENDTPDQHYGDHRAAIAADTKSYYRGRSKHTVPSRYQALKNGDDYPLRKTASEPSLPLKAQSSLKKKQIERRSTVSPLLKRKIAATVARRRIQLTQHSQSMDCSSVPDSGPSYSPSPPSSMQYGSHSHRDVEVPMDYATLCSSQNPYVIWQKQLQQLSRNIDSPSSHRTSNNGMHHSHKEDDDKTYPTLNFTNTYLNRLASLSKNVTSNDQPSLSRAQSNPHLQQSLLHQQQQSQSATSTTSSSNVTLSPAKVKGIPSRTLDATDVLLHSSMINSFIGTSNTEKDRPENREDIITNRSSTATSATMNNPLEQSSGNNNQEKDQAILAKILEQQQHQHVKQQVRQTVLQRSSSKTRLIHNISGGGSLDREVKYGDRGEPRQWSFDGGYKNQNYERNIPTRSIKNATTTNNLARRDIKQNRYIHNIDHSMPVSTISSGLSGLKGYQHSSFIQTPVSSLAPASISGHTRPMPLSSIHRNQHSSSSSSTSSLISQHDSLDESISQVIDLTLNSESKNKTPSSSASSISSRRQQFTKPSTSQEIDVKSSDFTALSVKDAFRQLELRQTQTNPALFGHSLTNASSGQHQDEVGYTRNKSDRTNLLSGGHLDRSVGPANFDPNLAAAHLNALRLSASSLTSITPSTTPTPGSSSTTTTMGTAYHFPSQQTTNTSDDGAKQERNNNNILPFANYFLPHYSDPRLGQCSFDNYLNQYRNTTSSSANVQQHNQQQLAFCPSVFSQSIDYSAMNHLALLTTIDHTMPAPPSLSTLMKLQTSGGAERIQSSSTREQQYTTQLDLSKPILQRTLSTPLFGLTNSDRDISPTDKIEDHHRAKIDVESIMNNQCDEDDDDENNNNSESFNLDLSKEKCLADSTKKSSQNPQSDGQQSNISFDTNKSTVLAYDPSMNKHQCICGNNSNHPENSLRIMSIWDRFQETGLAARCAKVKSRRATLEELQLCHSETYTCYFGLSPLQRNKLGGLNLQDLPLDGLTLLSCGGLGVDIDTAWNELYTPLAARMATGCVIDAASSVAKGEYKNAFAVVRPPGHHAEQSQAMGFCYFNSVAIAAKVLKTKYNMERILIVDWDVHHGNGIQKIFYDDPNVLYISLHRHDEGNFFPGTGDIQEVGTGDGIGKTINIAWSSDISEEAIMGDAEYMAAFRSLVMPISKEFNPSIVLVASGFDAADGHPPNFGGYKLTAACFAYMTRQLMTLVDGRIILVLEGGYEIKGMCDCAQACLSALLGDRVDSISDDELRRKAILPARETLHKVAGVAVYFWPSIRKHIDAIECSALDAILKEQEETIDISN